MVPLTAVKFETENNLIPPETILAELNPVLKGTIPPTLKSTLPLPEPGPNALRLPAALVKTLPLGHTNVLGTALKAPALGVPQTPWMNTFEGSGVIKNREVSALLVATANILESVKARADGVVIEVTKVVVYGVVKP